MDDGSGHLLRSLAAEAAHHAYAPYSNFRVGAALLLTTGEIVTGCNVEIVSFRLTTCAEQNAVTTAVAQCGPGIRIAAVAVAQIDPYVACTPCGACRQMLAEFAAPECTVFYPGDGGVPAQRSLGELFPASFQADIAQ